MALLTDLAGWVGWLGVYMALAAWNRVREHLTGGSIGAWQGKAGQGSWKKLFIS